MAALAQNATKGWKFERNLVENLIEEFCQKPIEQNLLTCFTFSTYCQGIK